MGKWIFALAGIGACVIGGFAANQGRVDLVKVSKAALDAPRVFEEGKKAGLLLDQDEVLKKYPIPAVDQNFALIVPKAQKLAGNHIPSVVRMNTSSPTIDVDELKEGLDLAVRESNRTGYLSPASYDRYGLYSVMYNVENVGKSLVIRAKSRAAKGDLNGGFEDFRAAKRIAKLISLQGTDSAWRAASSVITSADEAVMQLADIWEHDKAKLELLKQTATNSMVEFDVDRHLQLSCFGAMNYARNLDAFSDEQSTAEPRKVLKAGLAKDARGRYQQTKVVKLFSSINSAWRASKGNLIRFEKSLMGMIIDVGDGFTSPSQSYFSVSPAILVIQSQNRAISNIEARLMTLKLGRWPTLSEIEGKFTTDIRTGEKFFISYAGKRPELNFREESDESFVK